MLVSIDKIIASLPKHRKARLDAKIAKYLAEKNRVVAKAAADSASRAGREGGAVDVKSPAVEA